MCLTSVLFVSCFFYFILFFVSKFAFLCNFILLGAGFLLDWWRKWSWKLLLFYNIFDFFF